ncbi:MAG: hypothetical protein COB16_16890 [Rhodobacteraceae bacterium]|nr:MAG: hypothetical protein COB16_16890 [Paracoccaceae bacterium]
MRTTPFKFFVFHRELEMSCRLLQAGVSAILIDLEHRGKAQRQDGFDTEINVHSVDDLRRLRDETDKTIMCRISGPDASDSELSSVIENGADEIIIPMVRRPAEVERIIKRTDGHCRITVMIETVDGASQAGSLSDLSIDNIYVGLNDLHIQRGTRSIFAPLADGLLEKIRRRCANVGFGFGGLTLPNLGTPVPSMHLYAEMARLDCSFTFLRRSFYRDVSGRDLGEELANMKAAIQAMQARPPLVIAEDFLAMKKLISQGRV